MKPKCPTQVILIDRQPVPEQLIGDNPSRALCDRGELPVAMLVLAAEVGVQALVDGLAERGAGIQLGSAVGEGDSLQSCQTGS